MLNIIIISACDSNDLHLKYQKFIRGKVLTPAIGEDYGVIEVGYDHESTCLAFYKNDDISDLKSADHIYFKLYEIHDFPLAKNFTLKPERLSDIFAGEVETSVKKHMTSNNHSHNYDLDLGIPIHKKLHLVGVAEGNSSNPQRYVWTFKESGAIGGEFMALNDGEFFDDFKNKTGRDVYVVYSDPGSGALFELEEISLEHNH